MKPAMGWNEVRTEDYALGEMEVTRRLVASGSADPTCHFSVALVPGSVDKKIQAIDNLNPHQLRDLRTLLNHILGEEAS